MGIDAAAGKKLTLQLMLRPLPLLLLLPLPLLLLLLPTSLALPLLLLILLLLPPMLRGSRREGSERTTFRTVHRFGICQHP